jgi:hypothetical protein
MPVKKYRIPPGTVYPATVAGYKKAKAGKLSEVDWVIVPDDEEQFIEAPYPEIISSWLANGVQEVDGVEVVAPNYVSQQVERALESAMDGKAKVKQ